MDSPQNHIWGPQLWMILHSATEYVEHPKYIKLPQEESRIWINLLNSLRFSLPCPLCKKHFTSYMASNPLPPIKRDFVRIWLYNLHCQVNDKLGKPNTIPIEQLPLIYSKPFNFTESYNIIVEQMNRALRLNWSSRVDIQKTIRFFQEFKRFYDFI